MRVKFLHAVAGANHSYAPGQVVELEDAQAKAWLSSGTVEAAPDFEKLLQAAQADHAAAVGATQALTQMRQRAEASEAKVTDAERTTAIHKKAAEDAARADRRKALARDADGREGQAQGADRADRSAVGDLIEFCAADDGLSRRAKSAACVKADGAKRGGRAVLASAPRPNDNRMWPCRIQSSIYVRPPKVDFSGPGITAFR